MKGRDLVIVAAIAAIAGIAVADAVRDGDSESPAGGTGEAAASEPAATVPAPTRIVPSRGPLEPVAAPGRLLFTDAGDCRVRAIDVASGRESRLPRLSGDCELWAPGAGTAIAYGLGRGRGDVELFRLFDLARPGRTLGGYGALFGFLTWSPDGRRAAWCGGSRTGFDLELGAGVRRLPFCPSAYTRDGAVVDSRGDRLVVDGRTILRTDGQITNVFFTAGGRIAVGVDGARLQLFRGAELEHERGLPARLQGRLPIFSPDACAALFRTERRVELLDLGCFAGEAPQSFFGRDAAWSPDGRWVATAELETVAFRRVVGIPEIVRWPVAATRLAWRMRQ